MGIVMDTIIVAALIGLGITAELTLGQPQLWATAAGILAAALYMLIAALVLMARPRAVPLEKHGGAWAGSAQSGAEASR